MSKYSKFSINDILLNKESLKKKNKYSCPICFEFIYKKSIYQCRSGHHVGCQECWEKSLKNKKEYLSRNLVIEQGFGKKECYCIYSFTFHYFIYSRTKILLKDEENGCKEIINIDQIDNHLQNCKFKVVECSHDGCGKIFRSNSLEEHENQCGFKLVKCEYCACDDTIQKELEDHYTECPKFLIDCPQSCLVMIKRDQTQSHIDNYCNNSIIPLEMKRPELQNHLNNVNHQISMGLLIEKLALTLSESIKTQDELVKKIEESEKIQRNKRYY
ncbi:hypothetical protein ACTFIT_001776 [Dictyostelium discoideum]